MVETKTLPGAATAHIINNIELFSEISIQMKFEYEPKVEQPNFRNWPYDKTTSTHTYTYEYMEVGGIACTCRYKYSTHILVQMHWLNYLPFFIYYFYLTNKFYFQTKLELIARSPPLNQCNFCRRLRHRSFACSIYLEFLAVWRNATCFVDSLKPESNILFRTLSPRLCSVSDR